MHRYRLMWEDVKYEPGEIKVVAYDAQGNKAEEKTIRTAGKPHHIQLEVDRSMIEADGKDLAYITVSVVDKDGNLCPDDGREVSFKVSGAGSFRAAANGDGSCLDLFHLPKMHAFAGQLTAIVQSSKQAGTITLQASAKGLKPASIRVEVK
jgi:beta-galactosidase